MKRGGAKADTRHVRFGSIVLKKSVVKAGFVWLAR